MTINFSKQKSSSHYEEHVQSPLTDEEFFDAIEEIIESFDQAERNTEHNQTQLDKIQQEEQQSPPTPDLTNTSHSMQSVVKF